MDFYVIPPLANLDLMHYGDRYFILAQLLLRHEQYSDFVAEQIDSESWVTLDNGVGDHDFIDQNTLLELTELIMPNEVISLDVLFDGPKTIANHKAFVEAMDKKGLLGKVEIFFCPQGKDIGQWLDCYQYALESPHVNTIGFSKLAIPHAFGGGIRKDQNIMQSRQFAYQILMEENLIQKPIHCLGAGNPIEFQEYKNNPLIRSTDSCFSVLAAINNYNWKSYQTTRIPTPKNYFTDYRVNEDQLSTFYDNVDFLNHVCHGLEYSRK